LPNIHGSLKLADLRATVPQVPQPLTAKTATVNFTGQRAELPETSTSIGKSQMRVAAQVEKFVPVSLTYRLVAPELWLADFRGGAPTGNKPEVLREAKSDGRASMEQGSLAYQGRISSARGTIADMDYTNLQAVVSLANRVATIESFQLQALNGSLQGRGQYDMRETLPRFSLTSQVRNVDLMELLRVASPATPLKLRGGINLDLALAGSGNRWEEIQRTLSGQGQAEIARGALLDVNIAESALTGLTGVPGLSMFVSPRTRNKYPVIFATRNTEFDQLKSSLAVKDGKVHLDNLLISAADWVARGKGWVGLDRTLDMRTAVVLSPQLSTDLVSDVKGLKLLANKQGRLEIPLTLAGTLPGVTPKPDIAYVSGLLERRLLETGVEELTKGLQKGTPPPSSAPQQKEGESPSSPPPQEPTKKKKKPEEELLKGLKDIFGR
jgi:hypothetical protein